eukprot:5993610-Pleurochrysis_carterae.AAC.4
MRPKAKLTVRKLQATHALPLYPSMYDGVHIIKELKDGLANLHDAYDANEHEKEIERMQDKTLYSITARARNSRPRSTSSSAITTPTSRSRTLARG